MHRTVSGIISPKKTVAYDTAAGFQGREADARRLREIGREETGMPVRGIKKDRDDHEATVRSERAEEKRRWRTEFRLSTCPARGLDRYASPRRKRNCEIQARASLTLTARVFSGQMRVEAQCCTRFDIVYSSFAAITVSVDRNFSQS